MIAGLRRALHRLRSFWTEVALDRDLDAELAAHLEMATEENVRNGMSAEEAKRQALVRFGGVVQAKERHREARGIPALETLLQDVRYALRMLRRDPVFAAVAVLVLALGIAASLVVFVVLDALLLRPLPFRDPQQLVWLAGNQGTGALSDRTYRVDVYEALRAESRAFQELAAFVPYYALSETKLLERGEPTPVSFVWVSGNFLQALGVRPMLGRQFTPEETLRGGRKAVVLSHAFWQRRFAADPAIVGQAIRLGKERITVVGVLPPTFDFGTVFAPGTRMDFLRPVFLEDIRGRGHMLALVGRLKPGLTVAQAQAETSVLLSRLEDSGNPDWATDVKTKVTGLHDHVSGGLRHALVTLCCAVGLILLIVCVNLSNLLIERSAARSREFAMRSALGAGRGRLIRQLLTESAVLWGVGAALGIALACGATAYLARQESIVLPLISEMRLDGMALPWTAFVTMVGALVVGLSAVPLLPRSGLQQALKDGGPAVSPGRAHEALRAGLVVSEVALACMLLVGAGLLLRSFLRVLDVDLGFQPENAAALKIDYEDGGSRERRGAVLRQILEHVSALPGVDAAGVTDMLPLERNRSWNLIAKGKVPSREVNYDVIVSIVTPGYFDAMGMRLRRGRALGWHDTATSEPVIVINEAAARREWPGQDPVGQLALGIGYGETRVVGVVSDIRESSVELASNPAVYVPVTQGDPEGAELVVRSRLPPAVLAPAVMGTLRELNPGQPLTQLRPIRQIVGRAVSPRRFFALLVGGFAAFGFVLASLGVYGVIAYSVTRQRQAIGVRLALGATPARVQREVMARALRLTLAGIALGTVASFAASHLIRALLFETAPTDPSTFASTILLLGGVALVAGYVPARRASRVSPVVALRNE
jgi:predicted permease